MQNQQWLTKIERHPSGCTCDRCVAEHSHREKLGNAFIGALDQATQNGDYVGMHFASQNLLRLEQKIQQ